MNLNDLHFWYSAKQALHLMSMPDNRWKNLAKINGREVLYTTCHETMEHGSCRDDMVYLGHGSYSRTDGFW